VIASLEALLRELFPAYRGFDRFIRELPSGETISHELPSPDVPDSLAQQIFAAVRVLRSHGFIDSVFFASLVKRTPRRHAEISAIAERCGIEIPVARNELKPFVHPSPVRTMHLVAAWVTVSVIIAAIVWAATSHFQETGELPPSVVQVPQDNPSRPTDTPTKSLPQEPSSGDHGPSDQPDNKKLTPQPDSPKNSGKVRKGAGPKVPSYDALVKEMVKTRCSEKIMQGANLSYGLKIVVERGKSDILVASVGTPSVIKKCAIEATRSALVAVEVERQLIIELELSQL
jgi:hypothetical protein